jgi:hypothetical protein
VVGAVAVWRWRGRWLTSLPGQGRGVVGVVSMLPGADVGPVALPGRVVGWVWWVLVYSALSVGWGRLSVLAGCPGGWVGVVVRVALGAGPKAWLGPVPAVTGGMVVWWGRRAVGVRVRLGLAVGVVVAPGVGV